MRAILDTNIPVRFLTGDPPDQARRAGVVLRGRNELVVTDVILAELVYVLQSYYERSRTEVGRAVRAFLALPSVVAAGSLQLYRALELYEAHRLHFAEAYAASMAEMTGIGRVVSFDRQLDRVASVIRFEP